MFCSNCSAPITPETVFCPRCGVELRAAASPGADAAGGETTDAEGMDAAVPGGAPALAQGLPPGAELYVVPLSALVRVFGPQADPQSAAPRTRAQAVLQRMLAPRNATNLWLMAALGALLAVGLGVALGLPLRLACNAGAVATTLTAAGVSFTNGFADVSYQALAFLDVDPIKFFLLANRLPLQVTFVGNAASTGPLPAYWVTLPVLGTLLASALSLVAGGYLSASSLYARVPRYAVARGALIGPCYGAALVALAQMAAGHPSSLDTASSATTWIVAPQPGRAFFYGTLWGIIFGALGGWIAVSGRAWLSAALVVWRAGPRPRLAGALAGAAAAFSWGVLTFAALALGLCAFVAMWGAAGSIPSTAGGVPSAISGIASQPLGAPQSLALALGIGLVGGLPFAVWLFALAAGAPWQAFETGTGDPAAAHASLGLVGAQSALPPLIWLPLALVLLVSYLAGGRVAARVSGAARRQESIAAGASMAVPLAALMALAALAVSAGLELNYQGQTPLTGGVGPSVVGTFVAVLIGGAVAGGLGGLSTRWRNPSPGLFPTAGEEPAPPPPVGDGAGGEVLSRRWRIAGVVATVVFGVLAAAAAAVTATHAASASFAQVRIVDAALGALLVGVPSFCFGGSLLMRLFAPARTAAPPDFEAPLRPALYVVFPIDAQVPCAEPAVGA